MKKSKVASVVARVFGWLVYFCVSLVIGGAADNVIEKQLPDLKSEDQEVKKKAEKKRFLLTVAYGTSISIALRWLWLKADKEIQDFFDC